MLTRTYAVLGGVLTIVMMSRVVRADETGTASGRSRKTWRLELFGGNGFSERSVFDGQTANSFGLALGGRGTYAVGSSLVFGVRYDHYLGEASTYRVPLTASREVRTGASYAGVEAGLQWWLDRAIVRPYVSFGGVQSRLSEECASSADSFGALGEQVCNAGGHSSSPLEVALQPGLVIGVELLDLIIFYDARYFYKTETDAVVMVGGVSFGF